jgi:hypothetical protein
MNSNRAGLPGTAILLSVTVFSGSLISCGEEPVPLQEYPGGTARGVVFEDENGNGTRDEGEKGIPGVGVSDQRMVTLTDREGRWSLPAHEKAVYFVIKPRGFMTAVSEDDIPRFYYLHNDGDPLELEAPVIPNTGPLPESIDFPLTRQTEPDRFTALFMGDPQPRDQKEVDYLAHDVLEELVGTPAAFAVTLGDISFDRPDLYPSVNQATGTVGIPFYNTHGNHDANYDGRDTYDHYETWRTVYGPRYYSFDYGPVHFVILSNVLFPNGGTRYVPGLGEAQLEWLEADLSHVPVDRLVVLAMHIPLRPAEAVPDFAGLYELLRDRPHTLSFSAHSHEIMQAFLPEDWGWQGVGPHYHINAGATCGRWWEGAPDETDIPHSTSADGSPNGYFIVSFDGNEYSARFKAARRPADYQMQVQAPDSVARGELAETSVLANVFSSSPESTVEMSVGDSGEWVEMAYAPQPDPLYARVTQRESGQGASVSYHMWEAKIPGDLAPGAHLIHVRTRDRFGQEFFGSRILRVVDGGR